MSGSSPLTRGKPRWRHRPPEHRGLIPAHAGKTVDSGALDGLEGAHPRSRGENGHCLAFLCLSAGSSPLTRGKRADVLLRLHELGLIPAHAGKTTGRHNLAALSWAHPRSRGENVPALVAPIRCLGSSPLTRGKPATPAFSVTSSGLIPAHAGKTYQPGPPRSLPRAHPRSRGENAEGSTYCAVP